MKTLVALLLLTMAVSSEPRVRVHWVNRPVQDALNELARQAQVKLEVPSNLTGHVTGRFWDISFESAVRFVVPEHQLTRTKAGTYILNKAAPEASSPTQSEWPFHYAVSRCDLISTRYLLEQYPQLIHSESYGSQAIHTAARNGQREMLTLLLSFGADPNATTQREKSPASLALEADLPETLAILLKHGAKLNDIPEPIVFQAKSKKMLALLCRYGADSRASDHDGKNALRHLVEARNWEDPNTLELFQEFILRGTPIESQSLDIAPLLTSLVEGYGGSQNRSRAIALLLKRGADPNSENKHGATPLFQAASLENQELLKLLLAHGAKPNHRDHNGDTALFEAVRTSRLQNIQLLTEYGATLLVSNPAGETLLHEAAGQGSIEIVSYLLEHNLQVNQVDITGATPTFLALASGHSHVADKLISKGGVVLLPGASLGRNRFGSTLLHFATKAPELTQIVLAAGADPNARMDNGDTALHAVAWKGRVDVAKLLLKAGTKVGWRNSDGWSALDHSVQKGHVELAKLLVAYGASPSLANNEGVTPLHIAAYHGRLDVVCWLVEQGVDISALTLDGRSALDAAKDQGETEVVEFLLQQLQARGLIPNMKTD